MLLASVMALNPIAIGVLLPALPLLGADLGISAANEQQFVVGSYAFGMGLGTLFFGPLSDRFGRRAPLLAGLALYVVSALAAAFSPTFEFLLACRLVQGFGAAATMVITTSAVRDNFSGAAMARVMSLVFMVFMVVPMIAPAIGQLILLIAPWQGILFFSVILAGIVGAAVFTWLPESLPASQRRPLSVRSIRDAFVAVCSNRLSMGYTLAGMVLFGGMFAFISSAQQVYSVTYPIGPWFALAFAIHGSVMAIANLLNASIVRRFGMRGISHAGVIAYVVFATTILLLSLVMPIPLWLFLTLFGAMMFMQGLAGSNMNSLAMEPLGRVAGTASSVFAFAQNAGSAVIGTIIGQQFDGTIRPLAAGFFCMGAAALLLILFAERGRLFGAGAAPAATIKKAA